jgi:hypothetical protein
VRPFSFFILAPSTHHRRQDRASGRGPNLGCLRVLKIRVDLDKYGKVVKSAGIKAE